MIKLKCFYDMPIYEKCKQIHFVGLSRDVNVISAMNHARYISKYVNKNVYPKFKDILLSTFFTSRHSFDVKLDSKSQFLIYYGYYNYRQDHHKIMRDFVSCFDADYIIHNGEYGHTTKDIFRGIEASICIFAWLIQLLPIRISKYEKFFIIKHLVSAYFYEKDIKKLDLEKYKFLVVYYDASFDDNLLVQIFKSKKIITMTLQHGLFKKFDDEEDNILLNGMECACSISDYFLTWNNLSKELAIEAGIHPSKIKVLGLPRFVSKSREKSNVDTEKMADIGVFLGASSQVSENVSLIKIAEDYCRKNGKKYVIRLHPMDTIDYYKQYLKEGFLAISSNNLTLAEYVNTVSITLIGSSSALIDLVFMKHKTYHFTGDKYDKYSSLKYCTFTDSDTLTKSMLSNEDAKLYDELCTVEDSYSSYDTYFRNCIDTIF